jgi:hypothetical protein
MTCTLLLTLASITVLRARTRTEESQRDELQARVAQTNVHAGGCAARPNSAKIEPLRHEGLLGVHGLYAGARCMGVQRVVARSEGGDGEEHERREGELDDHVQTCREQGEGEDVLRLAIALFLLEHPLVVDGDGDGEEVPVRVSCHVLWSARRRRTRVLSAPR